LIAAQAIMSVVIDVYKDKSYEDEIYDIRLNSKGSTNQVPRNETSFIQINRSNEFTQ